MVEGRARKVEVLVDLASEVVRVQVTYVFEEKLFDNPATRFVLEGDEGGFSCVEKRGEKYYFVNYLRDDRQLKKVEERELTSKEVEEMVRDAVLCKFEQGW